MTDGMNRQAERRKTLIAKDLKVEKQKSSTKKKKAPEFAFSDHLKKQDSKFGDHFEFVRIELVVILHI